MKQFFNKRYYIFNFGLLFLVAIIISGCESIPPGMAPKGPLVNISDTSDIPMSQKDAINQMVTALATSNSLSGKPQNVIISESSYPELYKLQLFNLPITVYGNLVSMGIIKVDPLKQPDFNIYSMFTVVSSGGKEPVLNWTTFLSDPITKDVAYSYSLKFYLSGNKPSDILEIK